MKKLALAVTLALFCFAEGQAQISTLDLLLEKADGTVPVTLSAPTTGSAYRLIFPAGPSPITNAAGSLFFVGAVTGADMQTELLTPGTNGQVLRINAGVPTWQSVNLLPNGGAAGNTLVWDGTNWVANSNLTSNPTTGATTIGGDLTVSGTNVNLPAGSIDNTELANSSVTINTGTGLSGGGNVPLGGTLNLTNSGVTSIVAGTGVTVSGATGAVTINSSGISTINGTTNQVNVATPSAGTVTLSTPQDIHTGATPTFAGATLTALSGSSTATEIVVAGAGGTLQTRSISSLPTTGGAEPYVTFGAGSSSLTNNRVVQAGTGIDIVDAGSDNGSLTINNTGVTNAAAGTGLSVNQSTGSVTFTNTGVTNLNVGAGLSATGTTGAITLTNTGVTQINGTTNQINVTPASGNGNVTLSTPQDIHTGASPTFAGATLTGLANNNTLTRVLVQNASGQVSYRDASTLTGSGPSGWSLTGNAGTAPATNYLGTSDAQPLVIRTNGTERARVLSTGPLQLTSQTGATGELRFQEPTTGGTEYSSFKAQTQHANINYSLPDSAGKLGEVLIVKAQSGNDVTLDWADPNTGGGLGSFLFARKTADESVTAANQPALQNDDHLVLSMAANTTYQVQATLFVAPAGNSDKLDIALDVPAGSTVLISLSGFANKSGNSNTGNGVRDGDATGSTTSNTYTPIGLNNAITIIQLNGIVITGNTGGDTQLMWTPDANGVTATVRKNSIFSAQVIE